MKIRNDFVSNSSSSSFIVSKQNGLIDFFVEFKKIISDIHYVIFCWNDSEIRDRAYNYLISNSDIKNYLDNHTLYIDKHYDEVWGKKQMYCILVHGIVFKEPFAEDIISLVSNSDGVILKLIESWFSYNSTRLSQILTLLEYKGFAFESMGDHLDWVRMNEEVNHENQK